MLPLHSHEPGAISSQLSIAAATQGERRTAVEATHYRSMHAGGHRVRGGLSGHGSLLETTVQAIRVGILKIEILT